MGNLKTRGIWSQCSQVLQISIFTALLAITQASMAAEIVDYYGDSTVWGYKSGDGSQVAKPAPVAFRESLTGVEVRNEGVSGTTACDLLDGTDGKHPNWDTQMAFSNATVVIINHGINDQWKYDLETYKSCLTSLAQKAKARGKKVIFETPNPTRDNVSIMSNAMKEVASQQQASVIDQTTYLLNYLAGRSVYEICPDGLHPTEQVYIMKGQYAAKVFKTLFSTTAPAPSPTPVPAPAPTPQPAPAPSPTPSYILTISSPESGATMSGSAQIKGTGPGFKNIEIFSPSGSMLARTTPDAAGNFSASIDTTKLTNGSQMLTIDAWDSPAGTAFAHSSEKKLSINVQNGVLPAPAPAPAPQPAPAPAPQPVPAPSPTPAPEAPVITSQPAVLKITSTSARITWSTNVNSTGQIEYGKTMALGSKSKKEESFNYSTHIQTLSGLSPNTTYYYRITSTSSSGGTVTSSVKSFKTLKRRASAP